MNTAISAITQAEPQFQKIASQHQLVRWAEESQFALQAVQNNKMLLECAPLTIQDSIINIAAVGLTLNPSDGYAYLVPEYNKGNRQTECKLRISFKGLIKVATDAGSIKWVKAETVKSADTFIYRGPCTMPEHKMNPFENRGDYKGVYCIAKTHEDDIIVDVMSWDEILQIRNCAKTKNVWDNWPGEMAKKAIIKRAQKQWPKTKQSETLHAAVDIINQHEGSDFDEIENIIKTAGYIIEHIEKNDAVAVGEAWVECDKREQELLWVAKTKGGYFSQDEKAYIRTAIKAYHDAIDSEETAA
ncbi:MAG: hypothetical protein GY755_23320 [Chloroflexi bacterium]|nr:hypothetical protein [Chloroflexota bacterium]